MSKIHPEYSTPDFSGAHVLLREEPDEEDEEDEEDDGEEEDGHDTEDDDEGYSP